MSRHSENSPVLSGSHVRLAAHPIVVAEKHADGTPIVTLRREGQTIREIQIRCPCGELIVLDCSYDEMAAPPTPAHPVTAPLRHPVIKVNTAS